MLLTLLLPLAQHHQQQQRMEQQQHNTCCNPCRGVKWARWWLQGSVWRLGTCLLRPPLQLLLLRKGLGPGLAVPLIAFKWHRYIWTAPSNSSSSTRMLLLRLVLVGRRRM